jgi:dihydroorotase
MILFKRAIGPGYVRSALLLFLLCFLIHPALQAQEIDLLLKGGHVIDPKNNIDSRMDVAIAKGKILQVAPDIAASSAKKVIDVTGLYVTPGLIDMHAHHFPNISEERIGDPFPDGFTFRNGITTSVDAGSSGWKSFEEFKKQTIDHSKTRILCWLNIVGTGFLGREIAEQSTTEMDSRLASLTVAANRKYIIGIKVAHYTGYDWIPIERAEEAGRLASVPIMVDFGEHNPPLSIEELFMKHFRPGDIFTHCFADGPKSRETIVDDATGKLKPFVVEAQKKGVVFDVGHGGGAFAFAQAIPAMAQGFMPNSISTDWNKNSTNGAMKDLLNVMDKFMAMGMSLQNVIKLTTMNPAKEIQREELGNLSAGADADVAVFNLRKGNFGFQDVKRTKIMGTQKLEAELTIRSGSIVWDLNGISVPLYNKQ